MARRQPGKQTTLRSRATLSGVGVHCGRSVAVTLHPAEADTGITFLRTGIESGRDREIPADYRFVRPTDLCTTVGEGEASVATIEHIMAAFRGAEIDNVIVEIDGGEVPVMDGSADAFLRAFDQAGVKALPAARRYIQIERPVRVEVGSSYAEFRPFHASRIEVEIVQYLKKPPSKAELEAIVAGLDGEPQELIRTKDAKFTALGLDPADYVTADAVVALLVEHPEVMERPVLLVDGKAAIGRPTERIDALL